MFLNDLDAPFIKSLNHLYASDNLVKGEPVPLQFYLEEAIKAKSGVTKDLSGIIASSFKHRRVMEFKQYINPLEESNGSSSDKELELDLLKEDLMCIICNGMDVGARNRLLECSDCHMLYHQECHKPIVTNQDSFDDWVCQNCKDTNKKPKVVSPAAAPNNATTTKPSPTSLTTSVVNSSKSSSNHKHSNSNSYSKNNSEAKSEKYSKNHNSSSKNSNAAVKSVTVSSSSRPTVTPNINIISADKRLQIMKKKAAKLQEKRLNTRLTR